MKNRFFLFLATFFLLSAQNIWAEDEMFKQMEAGGAFEKIRANMLASCYIRNDAVPQKIDTESLKKYFPHRVEECSCFAEELSHIQNKTIFSDSRYAYQLQQAQLAAMQNNDQEKLKQLAVQQRQFKPFMLLITEKCGLK